MERVSGWYCSRKVPFYLSAHQLGMLDIRSDFTVSLEHLLPNKHLTDECRSFEGGLQSLSLHQTPWYLAEYCVPVSKVPGRQRL